MAFSVLANGSAQCVVLKKGRGTALFTRSKWQTRCVVVDPVRRLLEYSETLGSPVKGSVDLQRHHQTPAGQLVRMYVPLASVALLPV
jgi:hypothetical protein